MDNILITGFRPFGNYKVNPTEQFLKNHSVLGNLRLHSLIFPARSLVEGAEDFGLTIVETAKALKAVAIISLGMSSAVKGLRIETRAINWSAGKYCLETEDRQRLNPSFPAWYSKKVNLAHWDTEEMFKNFGFSSIRFEKRISIHAGTYCCNALMYRTLVALGPAYQIPYIFIHIPCSAEAVAELDDFDKYKDLIDSETLKKILLIVSASIK
jgi:pyroglutamyl-peptidase